MQKEIKERITLIQHGEVPERYQYTKAGLMPKDWLPIHLAGNIFTNVSDKKHDGKGTVMSVTQDYGIVPRSEVDIDIKYDENNLSGYKRIQKGNFIISLRSFQGGIEYSNQIGLVSPAYTVLMSKVPICEDYYRNYFKTNDFINRLNSATYGIRDGKQIGYQDFSTLILHHPPLNEQQRIAEILNLCDKIIYLKQNLIESEIQRKKWLLGYLLDENNKNNSIYRLDQVCNINCDYLSEDTNPNYSFYYIDIASVDNGQISLPSNKIMFKIAPVRARKRIKKNDILMSSVRPQLHAFAKIDFESTDHIASTGFTVLSPKNKSLVEIVYQQLFSENLDKQYNSLLVGTNYPALNMADTASLKVLIPNENIELISETFLYQDKLISSLKRELIQWKCRKRALMQLLLPGIVRVSV